MAYTNEIELKSWEEFEGAISSFLTRVEDLRKLKQPRHVSTPLFRGQARASWNLETTLDRMVKRDFSVGEYYRTLQAVLPAVVSITGKEWEIPTPFDGECQPPQGYEFMIYLRHHGFPSPLLDWTRSPYVAAYFAFRSYEHGEEGKVAIFSFLEYLGGAKSWASATPSIHGLGPSVVSHTRHYAQQCEYTICIKDIDGSPIYTSHRGLASKPVLPQDELVKFTLPANERRNALQKLELMNITAFSLFGNEESLMDTLAYQEIGKKLL